MRRLNIRQKFAVIFSTYIFIFFVVLSTIFFVVYQFLINRQIETVILQSMQDVISRHLIVQNDQLKLRIDSEGNTLKEYFLSSSISGIIFDKNNNVFKSYGVFALMDSSDDGWKNFTSIVKKNSFRDSVKTVNYPLANGKVTMLSVPLIHKDKEFGILVLGKSREEFDQAKKTIFLVTGSLGILGLAGSFFLGYILAVYAFKPVGKIIETVDKVDLEKLDKTVRIKGNPSDDLVNLSQKINKMFARLKVMAQNQKDFILNASHELKTPMTKAISALDIISLKRNTPVEKVKKVRDDLMEVNSLLDNLLSLSLLEVDTLPAGTSDLCEVLKNTISKFEKEISDKNLKIQNTVKPGIYVNVPTQYLLMIISNLLYNAIKYSHCNAAVKISNELGNPVILAIEDEGIGMREDQVKRIFKRFYRSSEAKKKDSGHGLGMSIVKQVCSLYKVEVSVYSETGKGTKVTLKFSN